MTLLTTSSKAGRVRIYLLVDNLRGIINPSVPQDLLKGILLRCPSSQNSSDGILDPVVDHAHVQLADVGHVVDPQVAGNM